jgi:putative glutathione S-transferase
MSDADLQNTNLNASATGSYQRHESGHRNVIAPDSRFVAEADRYHLHIALACPWACGVLNALFEKGLDQSISYSIVHPTWNRTKPDKDDDKHCGWVYRSPGDAHVPNALGHGGYECDDALVPDTVTGAKTIREVYEMAGDTKGPFTTPVLWDKKENTIVNNESVEILHMLNSAFGSIARFPDVDLFPSHVQKECIRLNQELVYPKINNGVYRCGFARSQQAYDTAVEELFEALQEVEEKLGQSRFLTGASYTWLDMRLFHTLVRFDPVYTCYFKTNEKRIADFPNLLGFMRDVFSRDAVRRSINMKHIKAHYYTSHPHLNTFGIIPKHDGPDLEAPHNRDKI